MNPLRWQQHWQILLGLLIGAALGWLSARTALAAAEVSQADAMTLLSQRWEFLIYDVIGDLFLNGLKLIIVPLVMSSLILAVVNIGNQSGFARMGLKTLAFYMASSLIAILIGLSLFNIVKPGATPSGDPLLSYEKTAAFADGQTLVESRVQSSSAKDFFNIFRGMLPPNIFEAASDNSQLLALIIVSLLIGYFMVRLKGESKITLKNFCQGTHDIALGITQFVLKFAPLGVGMLLAKAVSENYTSLAAEDRFAEFITSTVQFTLTVLAALGIHFAIALALLLVLVARINPLKHYRAMAPVMLTAFSTASSSATLPVSLNCLQKKIGVSNKTSSFVLPLGATVNMDGTALY